MDKNAKISIWLIIGLIVVAGILLIYFTGGADSKTLKEHAEPVDISTEQEGQGIEVHFYDSDGNPIEIPAWFKVMGAAGGVVGAIVEHPPAPTCIIRTDCAGAGANPFIDCWQGSCVLTNVESMDVAVKVTNGANFDFENVHISSATPVGFAGAFPSVTKDLPSGSTISFPSNIMNFESLGWVGTTQTLSVVVEGINSYDGKTQQSSDSIIFKFSADPTGGFSVVIQSAVPQ